MKTAAELFRMGERSARQLLGSASATKDDDDLVNDAEANPDDDDHDEEVAVFAANHFAKRDSRDRLIIYRKSGKAKKVKE